MAPWVGRQFADCATFTAQGHRSISDSDEVEGASNDYPATTSLLVPAL
jgi:hypothetical protein